jgi:hypothetical protein
MTLTRQPPVDGGEPCSPGPVRSLLSAASAANVSMMQISIAAGSAIGGLLVDSTGLAAVYTVAGSIALASAVFALIAGREDRSRRQHSRGALHRPARAINQS